MNIQRGICVRPPSQMIIYPAANEYLVVSGEGVHRPGAIADGRVGRAEPPVLAQRKVIRGYETGLRG